MKLTNKKVLITGAGGFIGSHLTERLIELGTRTRAMVHYNSLGYWGHLQNSKLKNNIEVFLGDVRDPESMKSAMRGVDIVFHLAALIAIPYSYQAPLSYVRTNVEGTLNILNAARSADVERIIHTSTSEVYGTAKYIPIDENHPLQGQSPYSASKIGADKIAESFHLSFDLPVTIIRPFNTYGPRQSARAIVPTIITQVLSGNSLQLGSLKPTRDLNFVMDTVEAFIRIAKSDNAIGQVVNIGSGREISIGDLSRVIMDLIGKDSPIVCDNQRIRPAKSEVERLCANNRKALELIGWTPCYDLKSGLSETISWIRKNLRNYRTDKYAI